MAFVLAAAVVPVSDFAAFSKWTLVVEGSSHSRLLSQRHSHWRLQQHYSSLSSSAVGTGFLEVVLETVLTEMDDIPGLECSRFQHSLLAAFLLSLLAVVTPAESCLLKNEEAEM